MIVISAKRVVVAGRVEADVSLQEVMEDFDGSIRLV